jgi:hypothetical protein
MTEAADDTLGDAADDGAIDALIAEERTTLAAAPEPESAPEPTPVARVGSELLMAWAGGRELMVRRADVYSDGTRRALEHWRRPTHAELDVLPAPAEAQYLRGGPEEAPKRGWVPWAIGAGLVAAVGSGAVLAWKYWPRDLVTANPGLEPDDDEPPEPDEDDPDDLDEDDDD